MIHDDEAAQDRRRKKIEEANYAIGFGKTPTHTKYKPGKSGNPKGRPKRALGIKKVVCKAAEAPLNYPRNGKIIKSTRIEVSLHNLALKAAKGDLKAIESLAKLYAQHGPLPEVENDEIDLAADEAVLAEYLARQSKFGVALKCPS